MSSSGEPEATLRRSMEYLRLKTSHLIDAWSFGKTERWDADLDTGVLKFSSPGLLVTAPLQVIGTFNYDDSSWMWGWDHPSVLEPFGRDALRVREFGERYGLARYVTQPIRCTEDEAWQFTALACHLAGSSGAYRGPFGSAAMFMTFGDVTIQEMPENRSG
jgi:hypothetical protein